MYVEWLTVDESGSDLDVDDVNVCPQRDSDSIVEVMDAKEDYHSYWY